MYDQLIQYGAIGVVLAWFMFRNEKKTDALSKAINNSNLVSIYLIEAVSGCPNNLSLGKDSLGGNIKAEHLAKLKEEIIKSS